MMIFYWFNQVIGFFFKWLIQPFRELSPIWSLAFISLLTGVLMVWIFGKVSNQAAIKRVKDKIFGNLLGVRLYRDNVRVVLRLQGRILRDTLIYMRYSLVPLLIMLIPVLIIMIQLDYYYGRRPLRVGEAAIVKSKVSTADLMNADVELAIPAGLRLDTPALRIPDQFEIDWRIHALTPGNHELRVRAGGDWFAKEVKVGGSWGPVTPMRLPSDSAWLLFFAGEAPLPAGSAMESIEIVYPEVTVNLFGISAHWIIWFFVLSLIFGFAVKDGMGVRL